MCAHPFISAAIVLLFAFQADGDPPDDECPGINATAHKSKPYYFTYESWVQKDKHADFFDFGRCVQTKNDVDLFVDWKKTQVKGFASPGWPCLHILPSPTADEEIVKSDLWYGAAPDKIVAPFREVKAKPEVKATPAGKEMPIMALESRVKMSIPRRAGRTKDQAQNLTKIDLRFRSSVHRTGNSYEYVYSWQTRMPNPPERPIRFRWMSDSINKAVESPSDRRLELSGESQTGRLRAMATPEYAVTVVEFLDEAGEQVIATASVALYHPAGSKP
jgi:hypothetical protein